MKWSDKVTCKSWPILAECPQQANTEPPRVSMLAPKCMNTCIVHLHSHCFTGSNIYFFTTSIMFSWTIFRKVEVNIFTECFGHGNVKVAHLTRTWESRADIKTPYIFRNPILTQGSAAWFDDRKIIWAICWLFWVYQWNHTHFPADHHLQYVQQ